MSRVKIESVSKAFGNQVALASVTLTVEAGEFLAVVGPSGCGKTTLLRSIAGFERIDSGTITIGQECVAGPGTHRPTHLRQVAIVPQEGALFPHLTVAENVGFGLHRVPAAQRRARVAECLELVGLPNSQQSAPHELSGGMRQRVAVARALAPRPPLILLDEPFSALDAGLRVGLRQDIRAALDADGATGILVTHDQGEALSMADRVAVMRAGIIEQTGTPREVYREPSGHWVATFLGEANILPVLVGGRTVLGEAPSRPERTMVVTRPERLKIVGAAAGAPGSIERIYYHGHDVLLTVKLEAGETIAVRDLDRPGLPAVGERVGVAVRTEPSGVSSRPQPS